MFLISDIYWFDPVKPIPPSDFANFSPLPDEDNIPTINFFLARCFAASAPIPDPAAINKATFLIFFMKLIFLQANK